MVRFDNQGDPHNWVPDHVSRMGGSAAARCHLCGHWSDLTLKEGSFVCRRLCPFVPRLLLPAP